MGGSGVASKWKVLLTIMNKSVLAVLAMVAAGGFTAGSLAAANGPQPQAQTQLKIEVLPAVEFGKGGTNVLKMTVLRPVEKQAKPMPAIVFLFGGAWRSGNRNQGTNHLARFAERGYFCASIDYRFSQQALFPAQLHDAKCAIRFLRAKAREFNLNPDRIGVWGMSSGAHLAALLGTSAGVAELEGEGGWKEFPSHVNAVVDMFGPTDFLKMDAAGGGLFPHNAAESPESRLIGGPIQDHPEKAAAANPIKYVSRDDPPFLILHGTADQLVPFNQSELLVAALKAAEVPVRFHPVPGGQHGFLEVQIGGVIDEFFDQYLKDLKRPAPSAKP